MSNQLTRPLAWKRQSVKREAIARILEEGEGIRVIIHAFPG
jgi:hypothetical protein